jgi:hypothetical protein
MFIIFCVWLGLFGLWLTMAAIIFSYAQDAVVWTVYYKHIDYVVVVSCVGVICVITAMALGLGVLAFQGIK